MTILRPDEPSPVTIANRQGASRILLVCEHAGNLVPAVMKNMGLAACDLERHIALDIGAADVARKMAQILDAPLFLQNYSRLVCDCNRQLSAPDFAPHISDRTVVPGNAGLSDEQRKSRAEEIFYPFHDAISDEIDTRLIGKADVILVTIHSFTPVLNEVSHPWHVGVLFNRDRQLSARIIQILKRDTQYEVGENQPYIMSDETDYTVPVHGEARGLACVEFEIRNDLIQTSEHQAQWAQVLCRTIAEAAGVSEKR